MANKHPKSLRMRKTDDYSSMIRLGKKSGLEGEELHDIAVAYGFFLGDELIACAALKELNGVYSVECLAVDEGRRAMGLGSRLLTKVEYEAEKRGAKRVWALARQPGFFRKKA